MELPDYPDIPLEMRASGCSVPLTARQLRVWGSAGMRTNGWRRCAAALRVRGPLNTAVLRQSIEAVLHRHESLRTTFVLIGDGPVQHIAPAREYQLDLVDLRRVQPARAEQEVRHLAQQFAQKKIAFSEGPLFEVCVFALSDHEHVLMLMLDHMISDGTSFEIVSREIAELYGRAVQGLSVTLPELPLQFADYAVWQQRSHDRWRERHEAWWLSHLRGVRPVLLPLDNAVVQEEQPATEIRQFSFGEALSTGLRKFAERQGTRLGLIAFALYALAMSRWCERSDLLVMFASHGRYRPELKRIVGYVATLPHLRIEVRKQDTLLDLLQQATDEFYSAQEHRDFDRAPLLTPDCSTELSFNWLPTGPNYQFLPANWTFNTLNLFDAAGVPREPTGHALKVEPFPMQGLWWYKFLPFFFDNGANDIRLMIAHQPAFVLDRTVQRFVSQLRTFATELIERPHARIGSI